MTPPAAASAGVVSSIPVVAEIGAPPAARTAPPADTVVPKMSKSVPLRPSCHTTTHPDPFHATAGLRWFDPT
ncbi:MAG: hypothetical protein ACK5U8_12395, partial [Deltaproteobacteria bacterium]